MFYLIVMLIYEYQFTLCYVYVFIYVLLYLLILIFVSINLSNQIVPIYVLLENYVDLFIKSMHLYNFK